MSLLDPSKPSQFYFLKEESVKIWYLTEKVLCDLTDGLKVIDNQLYFRSNQTNVYRFISLFYGSSERRQQMIDQGMLVSVDVLITWVTELTKHGNFTNKSIIKVSDELSTTWEFANILHGR